MGQARPWIGGGRRVGLEGRARPELLGEGRVELHVCQVMAKQRQHEGPGELGQDGGLRPHEPDGIAVAEGALPTTAAELDGESHLAREHREYGSEPPGPVPSFLGSGSGLPEATESRLCAAHYRTGIRYR